MNIEFDAVQLNTIKRHDRYKLLMASVIPRPIALVSSLNDLGKVNVAPFSNFMVLSTNESLLCFSVGNGSDGLREGVHTHRDKDTLHNVRERKEFVINMTSDSMSSKVEACAKFYSPDVSEAEENDLDVLPSNLIKTPRIAMCKIQFECELHSISLFGDNHLVVGRVLLMHAKEGLIKDNRIDPKIYAPLARLSGKTYSSLGDLIQIQS